MPSQQLVFRRLYPLLEWDRVEAVYWEDGWRDHSAKGRRHWVLTLMKCEQVIATLPYNLETLESMVTECEALGCNVSAYRHLLLDEPICSSGRDLESDC